MTTVRLPPVLRQAAGGAREVEVAGASTVAEALDALYHQHPTLRAQIQADDGGLHRFVNVYLNDEDVRLLSWLDTEVSDGDTLMILPAMAGGAREGSSRAIGASRRLVADRSREDSAPGAVEHGAAEREGSGSAAGDRPVGGLMSFPSGGSWPH